MTFVKRAADRGEFLCRVFDDWHRRDLGTVYVQCFDAAVETWMGHVSPLCTQAPMCGKSLAMERDGSLFPCDHDVCPEYRLGNVRDAPISDLAFSERQERFGRAKEATLPDYCRRCAYQFACYGECPENRFIAAPDGEPGLNYLCAGWKKFFAHVDESVQRIVRRLGATARKETTAPSAENWVPPRREPR